MHKNIIGGIALIAVGFLFGLSAVIAKYLSEFMSAYHVVGWRSCVALLFVICLLFWHRKKPSIKVADYNSTFFFAFSFAISVILFTLSIFYSTVSAAVFTFYASTLFSSFLIGYIRFNERVDVYKLIALGLVTLTLIILTDPFSNFSTSAGVLFGVASGVLQSVASTYQKLLSKDNDVLSLLFYQTICATLLTISIIIMSGTVLFPPLTLTVVLVLVLFGLSFLAISYLMLIGFAYTKLNTGSILVSSELIFAPLLAIIFLTEKIDVITLFGGTLMLCAVFLVYKSDSAK